MAKNKEETALTTGPGVNLNFTRCTSVEIPAAMREPVACAFFGGRFENSVIGPVRESVWNYDISSAFREVLFYQPTTNERGT